MKPILTILFIVFSFVAKAQELGINTTRFIGGDSSCGYTVAKYSIPTRDRGLLFVGYTNCYSGGGNVPANFPDSMGSLVGNVVVGKLDSNLNISWVKVYGGSRGDFGKSAVQTTDGGYAVLSYTQSNDINVSGNHGYEIGDIWLLKLDSAGDLQWQKCYGSIYDEQPGAITVTPDNGFVFFGISNGAGGDVPTHYSGSEFDYDWFVVKTDSIGSIQWSKSIGGERDEDWNGSILYANNSYYLISSSTSADHDCNDTAWCAGNAENTYSNYYIFKLDTANGNILWDSSYGGSGDEIAYQAIWDSKDSSIVVGGITTSTDYMVSGYNGGASDMWVIKTDRNGLLKWERCLGGINGDECYSVMPTSFGYAAYGRISPGSIGLTDNTLYVLDTVGNTLCSLVFGGSSYEDPSVILPYQNGFAATGSSSSPGFSAGINSGSYYGYIEDAFFSVVNYWPLQINSVNPTTQKLDVYPNPTSSFVNLKIPNARGLLTITNSIGEIVLNKTNDGSACVSKIYTGDWSKGLYIVKWRGADGSSLTNKLIVN